MPIHPPKPMTTEVGLGTPHTSRTMEYVGDDVALLTELWNTNPPAWSVSGVTSTGPGYIWISRWVKGQQYVPTRIFDETGKLVGTYCDMTSPIQQNTVGFSCFDLYLDVWRASGHPPEILDEDELEEAVADGHVTRQSALSVQGVAAEAVRLLTLDAPEVVF
jgi:predicted RNA-binding protein associated with RNAse of E/G family